MEDRSKQKEQNMIVSCSQQTPTMGMPSVTESPGNMTLMEKLTILSDAAKYDVSCSSSGVERKGDGTGIGNTSAAGICHSFSADGRCISLLKILFTNECIYDCKYCINRKSNDVPRASFTPVSYTHLTLPTKA